MNARFAYLMCAWCAAAAVHAQSAPSVPIMAESLTHMRGGAILGCGVRLTGGEPGAAVSSWFDVSFNIFARGFGVVQSIAYEIKRSDDGESAPAQVPVQSTWLKASAGSTRLGENTERSPTLIYTLLVEDVLSLFGAVANEQPLTLGIKRWGQRADSVYTATPLLPAGARSRVSACLAGLGSE